ncbi:MAG: type I methionyl aminopeptidase, partial [Prevotella sp.]|nr:type I methionyl aminopeptidase [Prevotella sp.]
MFKKRRWVIDPANITETDRRVMYWENKGKLVPTRDLIKT